MWEHFYDGGGIATSAGMDSSAAAHQEDCPVIECRAAKAVYRPTTESARNALPCLHWAPRCLAGSGAMGFSPSAGAHEPVDLVRDRLKKAPDCARRRGGEVGRPVPGPAPGPDKPAPCEFPVYHQGPDHLFVGPDLEFTGRLKQRNQFRI
jgi:hypothetical protein